MQTDSKNGIDEARPVVNLYVADPSADDRVPSISLGLEEEGIPWNCHTIKTPSDLNTLAKQAADCSKLNVGLAIDQDAIVLHHRDLPLEKPLFMFTLSELDDAGLRRLGANAARLVKGNPLLLEPSAEENPAPVAEPNIAPNAPKKDDVDPARVADMVATVLVALGLDPQNKDG